MYISSGIDTQIVVYTQNEIFYVSESEEITPTLNYMDESSWMKKHDQKTYMLFYIYIFITFLKQAKSILFRNKYTDSKTTEKTKGNGNF